MLMSIQLQLDNYVSVVAVAEQCETGDDEIGGTLFVEAGGIMMRIDLIVNRDS